MVDDAAVPVGSGARTLVLGGSRSGKSRVAEELAESCAQVRYVATGPAPDRDDADWAARVARHRLRRPAHWSLTETLDLAPVLQAPGQELLLVDSATTWMSGQLDATGVWEDRPGADEMLAAEVAGLIAAWRATRREVVVVSDEVGSGVVPATVSGRRFRDELGDLNLALAAAADTVWLVTAGMAQRLR